MEPILAFSYYIGMREQLNSCLNPLTGGKYQLFWQADQRRPITTDVPTEYPVGPYSVWRRKTLARLRS